MHKNFMNYAKVVFAFSIALLVYGIFLEYEDSKKLIDPINDVTTVKQDDDNSVSITPSEGSEVVSNDNSNNNSNNNTVQNNTTVSTLDQTNDKLRKAIQDRYSITVLYGSETEGYTVKNGDSTITTEPINNATLVNSQLTRLNETLSLYPKGMFKEIKDGGIPLTVVLINNYSENGVTGVTDSSYSYANISIAASYPFEESFFHESYHYIERYMFKKGANFNSWDSLNPSGFSYGTGYSNYSYSNTFDPKAPFVNNYAQTAATEDRASTFEYMMASSKASCLNEGNPVWKKATYMSRTIDVVLNTVSPDTVEYWERHL